jgi:hypothetical protein
MSGVLRTGSATQAKTGLELAITGTERKVDTDGKSYLSYTIEVNAGKGKGEAVKWEVGKRYSAFVELRKSLEKSKPGSGKLLPDLSGKTVAGKALTKAQLQKRTDSLEAFITAAAREPTIGLNQLFFTFLEAPSAVLNSEAVTGLWQAVHAEQRGAVAGRGTLKSRLRVAKQGVLKKKGTSLRTNWTTRWVVLKDYTLEYYESQQAFEAGEKPKNLALELTGAKVEWLDEEAGRNSKYEAAFEIHFPKDARVPLLRLQPLGKADGQSDGDAAISQKSWVRAIDWVIQRCNRFEVHKQGPGTPTYFAEELQHMPEDEMDATRDLLDELHAKLGRVSSSDGVFLEKFVDSERDGVRHLLAISIRWSSMWRAR